MKQRRKLKRRRKKKLRKWVKVFIIAVLAIALLVVAVIFGFKLQKVDTKLDLGQFTNKGAAVTLHIHRSNDGGISHLAQAH